MAPKDANDLLIAGRLRDITTAVYEARSWRPGGIVNATELRERFLTSKPKGYSSPWKGLDALTLGMHQRRLYMFTAGTGAGKSTVVAGIAYDLLMRHGLTVGYVALEEGVEETVHRFVSQRLGARTGLPGDETPRETLLAAFDEVLGTGRLFLNDHFGSLEGDDLMSKLRFMVKGCKCDVIVLDHVAIALSGLDTGGDERKAIDRLLTQLRSLVEETGVMALVISHLRRTDGKAAEDGGKVSLADLRGSHSIAQLSDFVIALERPMSEGSEVSTVKVLKNRVTGQTGVACALRYDRATGNLEETDEPEQHRSTWEHSEF